MATAAQDEQLAELLDSLTEAAEHGDTSAPERLISQQPELESDIRDLWGALMVTQAVATLSSAAMLSEETAPLENAANLNASRRPTAELELPLSFGGYELKEEIGRGGMGVVYRAYQKSLQREVALKLILRGALASPDDQQRFRSEAEAAARLGHPGVVPIYEVGEVDGQLFFSMPLIVGQTLANLVSEGPQPNREAARLIRDVARAIDYAHRRGVIHRDLKPANILIDRACKTHVSDFGLAKRVRDDHDATSTGLTNTGAILGTPAYMAPEQAAGGRGEVGPACDVFSLGAMLYALVTGRPPFQSPSPVDTVLMLLEQDPPPPRLLNRQIDRDLEMIILRSLQKPIELRYASAGELAADLDAYLKNEPITARTGQFSQVVARVFRETHHATVLENWGLLWMWHALVLLVICLVTNGMHAARFAVPQMATPLPYLALWGGGLMVWAPIFWRLRHRAGPVTAVERQIAHVWGGSVVAVVLLFVVEYLLGLPVLTLSPILGLISGMVFTVKAGILSGAFYLQAGALFLTSLAMAWMQHSGFEYSVTVYGFVSAATFFLPGLKYYRQSRQSMK